MNKQRFLAMSPHKHWFVCNNNLRIAGSQGTFLAPLSTRHVKQVMDECAPWEPNWYLSYCTLARCPYLPVYP